MTLFRCYDCLAPVERDEVLCEKCKLVYKKDTP